MRYFVSLISRCSSLFAFINISLEVAFGTFGVLLLQHLPECLDLRCDPVSSINSNYILLLTTRAAISSLISQPEYLVLEYGEDLEFLLFFDTLKSHRGAGEQNSGNAQWTVSYVR